MFGWNTGIEITRFDSRKLCQVIHNLWAELSLHSYSITFMACLGISRTFACRSGQTFNMFEGMFTSGQHETNFLFPFTCTPSKVSQACSYLHDLICRIEYKTQSCSWVRVQFPHVAGPSHTMPKTFASWQISYNDGYLFLCWDVVINEWFSSEWPLTSDTCNSCKRHLGRFYHRTSSITS